MSAQDLFDDGNRLFRDDLYWAALLRYEQASEAGEAVLGRMAGLGGWDGVRIERERGRTRAALGRIHGWRDEP